MKNILRSILLAACLPAAVFSQVVVAGVALVPGQVLPAAPSGGAATFSSITNTGLTSGRVIFSSTGGLLSDSASLTFNSGTGALGLGGSLIGSGSLNALNVAAGITPVTELEVDSTSTSSPRGIMSAQFNTGTDGARFHGRKARGTRASPLVVVTGDNLTRWVGSGWDGSNYLEMASIIFGTEGTIAATRVPTNIQFQTATNDTPSVLTTALTLDSAQKATFGGGLAFTASATNVADFTGLTKAGTSTTSAAVLATSLGVSGTGYFGGTLNSASTITSIQSSSGGTVVAASLRNSAAIATNNAVGLYYETYASDPNPWQITARQNSASATDKTLRIIFGGVAQHTYFNAADLSTQAGIILKVLDTTEATTGGLGSLTAAGGIFATKAIISDSDTSASSSTTGGIIQNGTSAATSVGIGGGNINAGGSITGAFRVGSTQALSGAGAANVTTETTKITSTGALNAITLADGVDGQTKTILHDVDGGSFVLTPTTKTGWTTFTSTVVGESITLRFVTTRGWMVVGSYLGVIAP